MNKINKYIFLFIAFIWSLSAFAQKIYNVEDVPNVHLQNRNAYVSDPEKKLDEKYITQLNNRLRFIDDSLSIQCATIVLPAIDKEASVFAHDLLNKWGVGDKETNKGLVILLVYGSGEGSQRDIFMATGYGLEGALPDAVLKYIQEYEMIPLLKEERFGEGLVVGLKNIEKVLTDETYLEKIETEIYNENLNGFLLYSLIGLFVFATIIIYKVKGVEEEKNSKDPYRKYSTLSYKPESTGMGCALIFFFPVVIFYFLGMYLTKKRMRKQLVCPHCKTKGGMKLLDKSIKLKATKDNPGKKEYTFICENCKQTDYKEFSYNFAASTVFSGSSKSGGSWSGGSSSGGGSWGGGSSGGGGAGSSF